MTVKTLPNLGFIHRARPACVQTLHINWAGSYIQWNSCGAMIPSDNQNRPTRQKQKTAPRGGHLSLYLVVGTARFELATYGTQNRRATRLRYAPTVWRVLVLVSGNEKGKK